ncbi:DUF1634 domain-containing protein [Flavobacterium sp. JP2137]|uniref:DUF1634 domain-containing protein n=1 Tax=Flavobacterium sp. JP2137 TaxID=3414510 RepID=UPI003D2FC80A
MTPEKFTDRDFQAIIGNLLRYGVWIALSVALLGGLIYLMGNRAETVDYRTFTENNRNLLVVVEDIWIGLRQGQGESIIFLGVLLLFLTPVLRIVLSLISFVLERDYRYVCITLIVIAIIALSISFGFSH